MERETLEKRASNIIKWKGYVPRLGVGHLSNFFASAIPELEEEALMKVYNAGFLSDSKQGNFSFFLPLAPNFGFFLDNKKLYFTLERNCKGVLESRGLSLCSQILKHGEYTIPEEINKHDWAVIRAKHLFSQEEIIQKLKGRNIISFRMEGNFSVSYKPSHYHSKIYLNFRDKKFNTKYYFTHEKDAINFSEIFPYQPLEILSH